MNIKKVYSFQQVQRLKYSRPKIKTKSPAEMKEAPSVPSIKRE